MSTTTQTNAPEINEAEILAGGMTLDPKICRTRKGEPTSPEALFVKKIAFLKMDSLARVWGDLAKECEVYVGMTTAQIDELSDATQEAIVKEGRRLNFTALSAYMEAQEQTLKAMGGGSQNIAKLMEAELLKVAQATTAKS